MKLFAYACRPFDEEPFFLQHAKELGVELGYTQQPINEETLDLCRGYEYLSILTNPVTAPMIDRLRELGVKMISTRTIGYDHVDYQYAKSVGMKVSNVSYTPECVADYTLMLMLMSLRKMKRIMQRAVINDFTLKGIQGSLLSERTGVPCTLADDPDSCVAYGCGKSLSWINHMQEGPINIARKRLMRE